MVNVRRDVEINLEFFGAQDGPLVVLVAGAGAPARFWPDAFCDGLAAAGYRALRYDHRDTGLSTHFDDPYPLKELRADLEAVIREAGGGPAHLVGHSMGGYLVQILACRGDLPVRSVTSISAGSVTDPAQFARLGMTGPSEETWAVLMKNQPTGDLQRDLPGWLGSWRFLNGQTAFEEERAVDYTRALYVGDERNAQVATNHIHAMATVPATLGEDLIRLTCPLLALHGTHDPLVPLDNGAATARLAANGRLVELPGAGHMFFCTPTWKLIEQNLLDHFKT